MGASVAVQANPRRDARRKAIMEAAAELFLTKGYGATSLQDVVARSGGSLSTLYELFGNKAGLFRALVEERCAAATAMFEEAEVAAAPPEVALKRFARQLFELVTAPEAIGAIRLIVSEGAQSPEVAEAFFAGGPDAGKARVGAYLAEQARRGVLRVDDPLLAAHRFCSMVLCGQDLRLACGLGLLFPPDQLERHLDGAVRTFLHGHRL